MHKEKELLRMNKNELIEYIRSLERENESIKNILYNAFSILDSINELNEIKEKYFS